MLNATTAAERNLLPIIKVNVEFHMIDNSFGPWSETGGTYDVISAANTSLGQATYTLTNLAQIINNPQGNQYHPSVVGDSRIRVALRNDGVTSQNELTPGVFHWLTVAAYNNYKASAGKDAFLIRMFRGGGDGETLYNGIEMTLNGYPALQVGEAVVHELIHAGGDLGHATATQQSCGAARSCDQIDLSAVPICGNAQGTPANSCGGRANGCTGNVVNNIMSYYDAAPSGLSPCQWSRFYQRLLPREYVEVNFPKSTVDLVTSSGTVTWTNSRFINQDIVVPAGSHLIVQCHLYMGANTTIAVKRGGKLTVQGGTIRRLIGNQRWTGITVEGNQSTNQPLPSASPNNGQTSTQAGIVQLTNATIHGAAIGVYTTRYNTATDQVDDWDNDYRGGVISADNTKFIDNYRGAAFMKYDLPNKSRFVNCLFEEIVENDNTSSVGVTIWACSGIVFDRNAFVNLDREGVFGIDYDSPFTNNTFNNCEYGIRSEASNPISGGFYVANNRFTGNLVSAMTLGQAGANRTQSYIADNIADAGVGASGIIFAGRSSFTAERNTIRSASRTAGVGVFAVGTYGLTDFCNLNCNTITGFWNTVRPAGDARNLFVKGNDLSGTEIGIRKANYGSSSGVFSPQTAPGNCFDDINSTDLGSIGSVSPSLYDRRVDGSCYDVTANSTSAWTLTATSSTVVSCGFQSPMFTGGGTTGPSARGKFSPVTTLSVGTARRAGQNSTHAENFESNKPEADLPTAFETQEDKGDVDLYSLYDAAIEKSDYKVAKEMLPDLRRLDPIFVDLQVVYLAFCESKGRFVPSDDQMITLTTLALNKDGDTHPSTEGNARAILWLLTGEVVGTYLVPDASEGVERTERRVGQLTLGSSSEIVVSPNPSDGHIRIEMPLTLSEKAKKISIVQADGRVVHAVTTEGQLFISINLDDHHAGFYILQILGEDGHLLGTQRLLKY